MKNIFLIISTILFLSVCSFGQKQAKLPSKISDAFVVEVNSSMIFFLSDEKNLPNAQLNFVEINQQTKIVNHKGKAASVSDIKKGMEVEIRLDNTTNILTASQIKISTNPENWETDVDGYLDKIRDEYAFVDGQAVLLAPNVALIGIKEWQGKTFTSFKDIPLGSLLDLKGIRNPNGTVVIKKGSVRPNSVTSLETRLMELVKTGLEVAPAGQSGAGVKIGNQVYKVSENLELNGYVNKVGNRVAPRFLRNLPPDDPNKILFRFYVLEVDAANAFAFSDGSVFVTTGLLKQLENEAQLAIIIGHEIAHVTNEHLRRMVETAQDQAFWMGLAGAATGAVLGQQSGILVSRLGFGLLSNKFSRKLEEQADRVGLYYAWEAGYDVREANTLWNKLLGTYSESRVSPTLYSDHPSLLSRYKTSVRLVISNYASGDFSEAEIGRESYMNVVGVYFGWIQPKPKTAVTQPSTSNKTNPSNRTDRNNKSPQKTVVKPQGDGFTAFFAKFKAAVVGNNRTAIKNMMSLSFEWALDGYVSRDEAFKLMDEMKLWTGLRSAVQRVPVKCKQNYCNNRAGYHTWSTPRYRFEIMFEKDASGNWFWTAVLGD